MAIKINQNILSILTQRSLEKATATYNDSAARLSSGSRLTKSADDPSAMASSQSIQFQITGLQRNLLNISGASSMLGTAETELDSVADNLQRARELVVQAGSDTLSSSNRQTIQAELTEIMAEIDRIAGSAKYGDQYLLNGQLKNNKIQVGSGTGEYLTATLGDFRTTALGAWADLIPANSVSTAALAAGDVTINGIAVPASASDKVSTVNSAASAIAKAAAINDVESQTGVHAKALPNTIAGSSAISAFTLDGTTNSITINGVNIGGGLSVAAGDASMALATRINEYTNETGVKASVDASGQLSLTADDGRNITLTTTGNIADELGLSAANSDYNSTVYGKVELSGSSSFIVTDATGSLGTTASPLQVNPDTSKALANLTVNDTDAVSSALTTIDAALAQVNGARSQIGALTNRLDSMNSTITSQVESLTSADSSISSADYAVESARYTQAQIIQEAAITILAQANVIPSKALELLRQ